MIRKLDGEESCRFQECAKVSDRGDGQDYFLNKVGELYRSQQENNLHIKDAMFRELARMDLPENIIRNILHLEDDPPF